MPPSRTSIEEARSSAAAFFSANVPPAEWFVVLVFVTLYRSKSNERPPSPSVVLRRRQDDGLGVPVARWVVGRIEGGIGHDQVDAFGREVPVQPPVEQPTEHRRPGALASVLEPIVPGDLPPGHAV